MQRLSLWLLLILLSSAPACVKRPERIYSYKTVLVPIVVFESDVAKVEAAIRAGADVNALEEGNRTALMYAVGRHISNSDRQMMNEGKEVPPENVALVKLLLDHGANPNVISSGRDTALHTAIYHGRAKTVRLLLEKGANPNLSAEELPWTPLMLASYHCYDDLVILLRQHHADVALGRNGETAVDIARDSGCPETTIALLQ
jgi:ankyrin repeat protein